MAIARPRDEHQRVDVEGERRAADQARLAQNQPPAATETAKSSP